jgi:hypothetical protein
MSGLMRQGWVLALVLLAALWLPRAFALDHFTTPDERLWLARSGNFYQALSQGDWANTFQRHHPGVTVTWAGVVGFLAHLPRLCCQDAPGQFDWLREEIEPFLRSRGHDPLASSGRGPRGGRCDHCVDPHPGRRLPLCGALARSPAWRLAGHAAGWPLPPFISPTRAFCTWTGWSAASCCPGRVGLVGPSAQPQPAPVWPWRSLATGLAWLTRSPALFLLPWHGRRPDLPMQHCRARPPVAVACIRSGIVLAVGALGGLAIVVLLWPAMWVDPDR